MTGLDRLPSFLCVGGAKCGTTSLYEYLRGHPQIYLPKQKELHYFAAPDLLERKGGPGTRWVLESVVKDERDYRSRFADAEQDQIIGDISPSYLNCKGAAARIKSLIPRAKIIILLRNPVDRMFSQYMHLRRAAREKLDFDDALAAEARRDAQGWNDMFLYRQSPRAADSVERYLDLFGPDQVQIILGEELRGDLPGTVSDILGFVGADPDVNLDLSGEFNRSGMPKSRVLGRMIDASPATSLAKKIIPRRIGSVIKRRLQEFNTGERIELPNERRSEYLNWFEDDIRKLERLIGRSTGWLGGQSHPRLDRTSKNHC